MFKFADGQSDYYRACHKDTNVKNMKALSVTVNKGSKGPPIVHLSTMFFRKKMGGGSAYNT